VRPTDTDRLPFSLFTIRHLRLRDQFAAWDESAPVKIQQERAQTG
jgi:hypothetical protein